MEWRQKTRVCLLQISHRLCQATHYKKVHMVWCYSLAKAWAPFSSPLAVFSPFLALPAMQPPVAEAGAEAAACCWAILSRYACCLVWTTSGMTASIKDRDSMGRPSNNVPSWVHRRNKCSEERWTWAGQNKKKKKREFIATRPHWCWLLPQHTAVPSGWCWSGQQGEPEHH